MNINGHYTSKASNNHQYSHFSWRWDLVSKSLSFLSFLSFLYYVRQMSVTCMDYLFPVEFNWLSQFVCLFNIETIARQTNYWLNPILGLIVHIWTYSPSFPRFESYRVSSYEMCTSTTMWILTAGVFKFSGWKLPTINLVSDAFPILLKY